MVVKQGFSVFWWWQWSEVLLYFERPFRSLKNILKTLLTSSLALSSSSKYVKSLKTSLTPRRRRARISRQYRATLQWERRITIDDLIFVRRRLLRELPLLRLNAVPGRNEGQMTRAGIPNLGYIYQSEGVHLRLATEEKI